MNALHQTLLKHITPDADGLMTVERDDEDVLSLSTGELTRYSQRDAFVVDSTPKSSGQLRSGGALGTMAADRMDELQTVPEFRTAATW